MGRRHVSPGRCAHLLGGKVAHIELLRLHNAGDAPSHVNAQLLQDLDLPGVICLQQGQRSGNSSTVQVCQYWWEKSGSPSLDLLYSEATLAQH